MLILDSGDLFFAKYIYIDGRIIEDTFEEGDIIRLNRASNHNKVDQNDIKGEEESAEYSF